MVETNDTDQQSSLLRSGNNYDCKNFCCADPRKKGKETPAASTKNFTIVKYNRKVCNYDRKVCFSLQHTL